MTKDEKEWYNDAFLEGRFMSNVHISFKPTAELRKEQNQYKISEINGRWEIVAQIH